MILTTGKPHAISSSAPMQPYWAEISDIVREAPDVSTFWLKFLDPALQEGFHFRAGQFNMVSVPGLGEAAISISSDIEDTRRIGHTLRAVGNVTSAINRMDVGGVLGIRGPFGSWWPLDQWFSRDIVIAAGGIGLPPMRPVLYYILNHRRDFGKVIVLYGARSPNFLQFTREYKTWQDADIELQVTVDRGDDTWQGRVGVVPILFYNTRVDPRNTVILTCGPEIMIRFVIFEALARRVPPERIFVSLERNMKCGLGSCGHCQIGPFFVCKDGPVFSFDKLQPYVNVEEL
jgi:NAD(P)H-flavin reductase